MKILIDHGASYNLGDTSMLEGVTIKLINIFPGAEIFIVNRPNTKTNIWDLSPKIHKQNFFAVKFLMNDCLENVRFVWRYSDYWKKFVNKIALFSIGNFCSAGTLLAVDKTIRKSELISFNKLCEPFDVLFITGGGYLTDIFLSALLTKTCLMRTFIEQNKSVILTGQQIGPFNSFLSKYSLFKALHDVNFIGLRDPGDSLSFCKTADIDPRRITVMGDDSFGISAINGTAVSNILEMNNLETQNFLVVNIRVSSYAKEIKIYLKKISMLLEKLGKGLKMPILMVPISYNSGDSDLVLAKKIAKSMSDSNVKVLEYPNPNPALTKGIIAKAFGAIGVSYHFCTFALSQGVPAVCIYGGEYYSQKAKGLCLFWGDDRFGLSLGNINNIDYAVEKIKNTLNDVLLRKNLHLFSIEAQRRWHEVFDNQIKNIIRVQNA